MTDIKINTLPALTVIRPEYIGEVIHRPLTRMQWLRAVISEFIEVYLPVLLVFPAWLCIIYFMAKYLFN